MALVKTWADSSTGLQFDGAYHRINGILLDYVAKQTQFVVLVYRDTAARRAGLQPFANRSFAVRNVPATEAPDELAHNEFDDLFGVAALDVAGRNPVAAAYGWLKRHPLYQGAVDG